MSNTPEGRVKTDIRRWLEQQPDTFFFLPVASPFGKSGIPDIIICHGGKFIGVETKAPGKRYTLTERQKEVGWEIVEAGGMWTVAESLDELKAVWPING